MEWNISWRKFIFMDRKLLPVSSSCCRYSRYVAIVAIWWNYCFVQSFRSMIPAPLGLHLLNESSSSKTPTTTITIHCVEWFVNRRHTMIISHSQPLRGPWCSWSCQSLAQDADSWRWRVRHRFSLAKQWQHQCVPSWDGKTHWHGREQVWTGHCAIVPWHRRPPPSTNTGDPWPLRNFLINKQ